MPSDFIKTIPQYLIPQRALTAFAGFLANVKILAIKNYLIRDFLKKYDVNMNDALEEDAMQFSCFNDFFIRRLKSSSRPISDAPVVSPVDGTVSEIGPIQAGQIVQAKGWDYSVHELLACDPSNSALFDDGLFATLYLSPKDYHRVHMPMEGTLRR